MLPGLVDQIHNITADVSMHKNILDDLPLSNFGKVSKKRLSEMAADRAVSRPKPARA